MYEFQTVFFLSLSLKKNIFLFFPLPSKFPQNLKHFSIASISYPIIFGVKKPNKIKNSFSTLFK